MQDGNYDWLNKLETKIDNITVEFTRTSTEILTKLDIYLSKQDNHEERLMALETYKYKQEGVNDASTKRWNKTIVILVALEVVFLGLGLGLAQWLRK